MKTIMLIFCLILLTGCQSLCGVKGKQAGISQKNPCGIKGKRAGITSNPERRQKEWKRVCPSLYNFTCVKRGLTYEQAQEEENKLKAKGYDAHAGGEKVPGSVYCFYTFSYNL